jgi:pimeloyl-ACP methyl ester carboxylesterase
VTPARRLTLIVAAIVLAAAAGAAVFLLTRSDTPPPLEAEPPAPPAVLLIPGYGGGTASLVNLDAALQRAGYTTEVLDIGDGTGDLQVYADSAVERAQRLRDAGAPKVSSVGFSAGGITGRLAALDDPEAFDDVISLATPHEGTLVALLGGASCPPGCQQLKPGSDLLTALGPAPDPADWLSVYSTTDEVILPPTSSVLDGATVLPIQQVCPTASVRHGQVPTDRLVIEAVTAFLAGQALPTACPAS